MEEVTEGADESAGDAVSLKAAHRRRRSKGANAKGKKKKKTKVTYGSRAGVASSTRYQLLID